MKRGLIAGLILGLAFGVYLAGFFMKEASTNMLFKEIPVNYSFDKTVNLLVNRINSQKGWHVTNIVNQEAVIKKYTNKDVGKVKIIKFCNPEYAYEMLKNDGDKVMAVKMPLSIAVYEKSDGKVVIGLMNGYLLTRMMSGTYKAKIMEKVVKDIESILGFVHFRYTIF